ncbi:MAG: EamA family transporter [Gammaproteobacteria bacterium]
MDTWVLLALLAAFSLATADAVGKRFLPDYSAGELALARTAVTATLLFPVLGMIGPFNVAPGAWPWILVGMPAELLAMYGYMRAIESSPLSLTLPYMAFTPAFAAVLSWWILDEAVSAQGGMGLVLVVAGAWWLNLGRAGNRPLDPLRSVLREPGAVWMLAVAAIYGFTATAGKAGMEHVSSEQGDAALAFGIVYFGITGLGALLLFGAFRPRRLVSIWRRPGWMLLVAGLFALMVLAHFSALHGAQTAYMIAVKRLSLVMGILYGAWWFREVGLRRNLSAAALMVLGAGLITAQ